MKPAMYIFINRDLRMSPGKIAAQAGHAAVEAAMISAPMLDPDNYTHRKEELWKAWRLGGHYAKYIMEARDTEHMRLIERYLRDRGFNTAFIIDEGHTEVKPISATAMGVELVDKDDPHTAATFSTFKLYKEPRPEPPQPRPLTLRSASRRHLYGYPIRLLLDYDKDTELDVSGALTMPAHNLTLEVNCVRALDIVSAHEAATARNLFNR